MIEAFLDRIGEFGLTIVPPPKGKPVYSPPGEYWLNGASEWQFEMFKWAVSRMGGDLELASSHSIGWWTEKEWKYGPEGCQEAKDFGGLLLFVRFKR